jgi:hypothetical protein
LGTAATTAATAYATAAQGGLADNAVPETLIAAKGDLFVGTANDTAAVLTVGANTFVLTADSAEATGTKWAAAAGGADNFVQATGAPTGDAALLWWDTDEPGATQNSLTNIVATTQAGTTYTIATTDAHSMVYCSNAALVTVTIPLAASVNFADGDRLVLLSTGAGGLTLSVTGITLLGSSPKLTVAQNEAIYLENITADTWAVIGGTAV